MSITDWKKGTSYLTFYTPWFFYPTITKKCFEFPVKLFGACFTRKNKVTPQLHNWAEPKTTSLTPSLRVPSQPWRGRTWRQPVIFFYKFEQTGARTPNIVGPTTLGVVASVLAVVHWVCKRMQELPLMLGSAVHRGKDTNHKTLTWEGSVHIRTYTPVGTAEIWKTFSSERIFVINWDDRQIFRIILVSLWVFPLYPFVIP